MTQSKTPLTDRKKSLEIYKSTLSLTGLKGQEYKDMQAQIIRIKENICIIKTLIKPNPTTLLNLSNISEISQDTLIDAIIQLSYTVQTKKEEEEATNQYRQKRLTILQETKEQTLLIHQEKIQAKIDTDEREKELTLLKIEAKNNPKPTSSDEKVAKFMKSYKS